MARVIRHQCNEHLTKVGEREEEAERRREKEEQHLVRPELADVRQDVVEVERHFVIRRACRVELRRWLFIAILAIVVDRPLKVSRYVGRQTHCHPDFGVVLALCRLVVLVFDPSEIVDAVAVAAFLGAGHFSDDERTGGAFEIAQSEQFQNDAPRWKVKSLTVKYNRSGRMRAAECRNSQPAPVSLSFLPKARARQEWRSVFTFFLIRVSLGGAFRSG